MSGIEEICDICGNKISSAPFSYITPSIRIENVCGRCINLLANKEWDKLNEILAKSRGYKPL